MVEFFLNANFSATPHTDTIGVLPYKSHEDLGINKHIAGGGAEQ